MGILGNTLPEIVFKYTMLGTCLVLAVICVVALILMVKKKKIEKIVYLTLMTGFIYVILAGTSLITILQG